MANPTRPARVAALIAMSIATLTTVAVAQVGQRSPSEKRIVNDDETGIALTVLTDGRSSDSKLYQTHPNWTSDKQWIVFRSSGRAPGSQAYAVNESSGDIVQLTEGAGNGTGSLNVAQKSMKLYFLRDKNAAAKGLPATRPEGSATTSPAMSPATTRTAAPTDPNAAYQMIETDLARLFADSAAGQLKPAAQYERVCGELPRGMRDSGGFGLDADEGFAYIGVRGGDAGTHLPPGTKITETEPGQRMGAGPAGLRSMNLRTGEVKVIIDTPFLMGHVQTNPFVPGEILYCHETGGDGAQRMYTTRADGTGNRPLFVEQPLDWVTHEAVVTKDEVMFNLIGHQKRLRVRPTGIAIINLRTDAVEIVGQLNEQGSEDKNDLGVNAAGRDSYGGFWHCNGSADGRWAVGDTFLGNLWLINRADGRRTLLTVDHKMKPDHLHPTFHPDGSRVLVQSGKWTNGERLQIVVVPIPTK